MNIRSRGLSVAAIALAGLVLPALAAAQVPTSQAAAKELTAALDAKKLDAIAAKLPGEGDRYAAALYFPNLQILVIAGKYQEPTLLNPQIGQKLYRDVYTELSGTVSKESKIFVLDMGAPGLTQKKVDGYFDTWTQAGKQVVFDGNPGAQKISSADYDKTFSDADAEYTRILGALLAEAKK
jgi:hypothetical protein